MYLSILQVLKPLTVNPFFDRLNEGGPIFMYATLLLLIIIIILLVKAFLKRNNNKREIRLVSSISLFALVWGFLGQMFGFIGMFDAIAAAGDISPSVVAGGIKTGILSPLFGMVVFLIARLGIIILTWIQKEDTVEE